MSQKVDINKIYHNLMENHICVVCKGTAPHHCIDMVEQAKKIQLLQLKEKF